MSKERRKSLCPKCGSPEFLVINGDVVYCVAQDCGWETKSKRETDKYLPKGVEKC
jgi:uncharacterized Zn finger protein (UPF0148 family)